MAISTPYRFVPLSRLIVLPDWADQVSHDQPFADGLCGELRLRLTAHTRLCVGGRQTPGTDQAPGQVHFFRTPDNQFAIPPSSLKGMLRNVLEIASFARFRQVEDQKLGVRDISSSNTSYAKMMVANMSRTGWLSFDKGTWKIRPCDVSRIDEEHLIKIAGIAKHVWNNRDNWPAKKRYDLLGLDREIRFQRRQMEKERARESEALPDKSGKYVGSVVITGKPSLSKRYEFVFHDEKGYQLPVSADVMAGFQRIHESSIEWAFWLSKLSAQELRQGVPVFYHADGNGERARVRSLGLAMMYKLPYTNSVHDAIRHTHDGHLDGKAADLPELLFGRLGDDEGDGLRGRVNIGFAFCEEGQAAQTQWSRACVLNGPKATFYPSYIRQGKSGKFRDLMEGKSELAGWKRYQIKPEYFPNQNEESTKVQTRLELLPVDTRFNLVIRLHNLRRVELGALLWALNFGGRTNLRHGLGVGKPFGLGQVSLEVIDSRLRPNDPAEVIEDDDLYRQACCAEFVEMMNRVLEESVVAEPNGIVTEWEKCAPIKALFDYATPVRPQDGETDYAYLPLPAFRNLKKPDNLGEAYLTFHAVESLNIAPNFDTEQPRAYKDTFAESLAMATEALAKAQDAAVRNALRQHSSEEDNLLMDLEDLVKAATADGATSSAKDNLAKKLRIAADRDEEGCFDDVQRAKLNELAGRAMTIKYKKIESAANKLLR